jgi:hypothetical protein
MLAYCAHLKALFVKTSCFNSSIKASRDCAKDDHVHMNAKCAHAKVKRDCVNAQCARLKLKHGRAFLGSDKTYCFVSAMTNVISLAFWMFE